MNNDNEEVVEETTPGLVMDKQQAFKAKAAQDTKKKASKKKTKAKPCIKDEKIKVFKEFFELAEEVEKLRRDGIVWRKIVKKFCDLDFDKVREALSKK